MVEYWDLYDKNRNKLDKIARRGDKLQDEEYHLVVNAWIKNNRGEFLITQRAANKTNPLLWETTGGSALLGESSIEAALREVKEELGIEVDPKTAKFLGSTLRYYKECPDILDVWLFESNVTLHEVKIQEEEVNDAMWASKEKILDLYHQGKFHANLGFQELMKSNNSNEKND